MAFRDILLDFMAHTGLKVDQRTYATRIINGAAEELYNKPSFDPANCLREQVFSLDTNAINQCTLPYYVGALRGVREYQTGLRADMHDMRPRYTTQGWREQYDKWLTFRKKHEVALARDIANEGPLTLTLTAPAAEAINVNVVGASSVSARVIEVVAFAVGDTVKATSNSFNFIEAIEKDNLTTFDLNVTDIDGVLLAYIANNQYKSRYTLIQIPDYPQVINANDTLYIEVIYKLQFSPFKNDFDQFPATGYDKAIYWKSLEHWFARKEDKVQEMLAAGAKCAEVLNDISVDNESQTQKKIDFGRNQYLGIFPEVPRNSPTSTAPSNPYPDWQ